LTLQLVPIDVETTPTPAAGATAAPRHRRKRDAGQAGDADEPRVQEADLWLSAGPERLPLKMRTETFWGWVAIELTERVAG
jgi:hypothetical protein